MPSIQPVFMDSTSYPQVETPVLIVGAGAAGLAVGACLRQKNITHQILERNDRPGSAWHTRYDRLHLHTHRQFSALPHLPFPKHYPRYPSRKQVAEYLASYASTFGLAPRYGQQVVDARPDGQGWIVTTTDTQYKTSALVIATGQSHTPYHPSWPGLETFPGDVLHSAEYTNGSAFKGASVLVVGFGNSAAEIALDLHEHGARVAMGVRGQVNVSPRDMLGMSTHAVSVLLSRLPVGLADGLTKNLPRLMTGNLSKYGIHRLPYGGMMQIEKDRTTPLLDIGTVDLIKQGRIAIYPGIDRIHGPEVTFADGRRAGFDAILLATGYRQNLTSFLRGADAALDDEGHARTSGEPSGVPGLYFCGFRNARGGLLREAGREAQRLADLIATSPQ